MIIDKFLTNVNSLVSRSVLPEGLCAQLVDFPQNGILSNRVVVRDNKIIVNSSNVKVSGPIYYSGSWIEIVSGIIDEWTELSIDGWKGIFLLNLRVDDFSLTAEADDFLTTRLQGFNETLKDTGNHMVVNRQMTTDEYIEELGKEDINTDIFGTTRLLTVNRNDLLHEAIRTTFGKGGYTGIISWCNHDDVPDAHYIIRGTNALGQTYSDLVTLVNSGYYGNVGAGATIDLGPHEVKLGRLFNGAGGLNSKLDKWIEFHKRLMDFAVENPYNHIPPNVANAIGVKHLDSEDRYSYPGDLPLEGEEGKSYYCTYEDATYKYINGKYEALFLDDLDIPHITGKYYNRKRLKK